MEFQQLKRGKIYIGLDKKEYAILTKPVLEDNGNPKTTISGVIIKLFKDEVKEPCERGIFIDFAGSVEPFLNKYREPTEWESQFIQSLIAKNLDSINTIVFNFLHFPQANAN